MDVYNLIYSAMGVLALTLIVIFLLFGYFAALGTTVISQDKRDEINAIHAAHIVENCLKNKKEIIEEAYLISVNNEKTGSLCGIHGFATSGVSFCARVWKLS